jgi:predicted nucleic acid-binding protein
MLFDRSTSGGHELLASPHVLEEARRNVTARYPQAMQRFDTAIVPRLRLVAEAGTDLVEWAAEQGLPESDAPVLAAAVQARADVLATGDRRHFGRLFGRVRRGVKVVTLREAVALLSR